MVSQENACVSIEQPAVHALSPPRIAQSTRSHAVAHRARSVLGLRAAIEQARGSVVEVAPSLLRAETDAEQDVVTACAQRVCCSVASKRHCSTEIKRDAYQRYRSGTKRRLPRPPRPRRRESLPRQPRPSRQRCTLRSSSRSGGRTSMTRARRRRTWTRPWTTAASNPSARRGCSARIPPDTRAGGQGSGSGGGCGCGGCGCVGGARYM